ncbi:hypothetical protein FB45DRAFT_919157 [Roridomyces roridus]|uniref:Transmembrane protein n=1 Tax=Roridomyces roridus TaxID=1738132 RepID=A0AAD7FK55_9AGAR|nr:hypothetical protein FB45DRAFT_919157 [Roridomyces roridus]
MHQLPVYSDESASSASHTAGSPPNPGTETLPQGGVSRDYVSPDTDTDQAGSSTDPPKPSSFVQYDESAFSRPHQTQYNRSTFLPRFFPLAAMYHSALQSWGYGAIVTDVPKLPLPAQLYQGDTPTIVVDIPQRTSGDSLSSTQTSESPVSEDGAPNPLGTPSSISSQNTGASDVTSIGVVPLTSCTVSDFHALNQVPEGQRDPPPSGLVGPGAQVRDEPPCDTGVPVAIGSPADELLPLLSSGPQFDNPNCHWAVRILDSCTHHASLRAAGLHARDPKKLDMILEPLRWEWFYLAGVLLGLAALETSIFSTDPENLFNIDLSARNAIVASSIATGLSILCDAWFLIRFYRLSAVELMAHAEDAPGSHTYLYFSLSARLPLFGTLLSLGTLVFFLTKIALNTIPAFTILLGATFGAIFGLGLFVRGFELVCRCAVRLACRMAVAWGRWRIRKARSDIVDIESGGVFNRSVSVSTLPQFRVADVSQFQWETRKFGSQENLRGGSGRARARL